MPKPKIGLRLPILKVEQFRRALERNGFVADKDTHSHIQYINTEGIKITVMKGRKDIKSGLLKKIIKEIAHKTNRSEEEIIYMLFNIKMKGGEKTS